MPHYDYKCDECGHVEDVQHLITAEPEIPCPQDESHGPMRRLISGSFSTFFKGAGFSCNSATTEALDEACAQAKAEGMDPGLNKSRETRERMEVEQFRRMEQGD